MHTTIQVTLDAELASSLKETSEQQGLNVGDDIILGRDILNRLALLLDGPQQYSELVDDATLRRIRSRRKTDRENKIKLHI